MRDRYGSTAVQALRTVLPFQAGTAEEKRRLIAYCFKGEAPFVGSIPTETSGRRARLLEALIETPVLPMELVTGSLKVTPSVWHDGRDGTADLPRRTDLPDACGAQGAAKSDAAAF
ncbi:MAG: hypothetical protein ACLTSZ_08850 [Lachnospiraceae bacterium]